MPTAPHEWKPGPIAVDGRGNVTLTPHEGEPLRLQRRDIPSLIKQLQAEEERYRSIDGGGGGPYRTRTTPVDGTVSDLLDTDEVTPIVPFEPIMQFFVPSEMPKGALVLGRKFADLATAIILGVGRNGQRTLALQRLLESQDCVRHAAVYKAT